MTEEKFKEYIITALCAAAAWLSPLLAPFLLIGAFDAIDFITGIRASRKQGKQFALSVAQSRTIDKLTGQGAAILVAFLLQKFVFINAPVVIIVEIAIVYNQVQSIRENVKVLNGVDILKDVVVLFRKNKRE